MTSRRPHLSSTDAPQKSGRKEKGKIISQETSKGIATKNRLPQQGSASNKVTSSLQAPNTPPASLASQDAASFSSSDNTVQDPGPTKPEGLIPSIIRYNAEDSIVFCVKRQTIHLHGAGVIEHGTIKLEAEEVSLDWNHHIIAALSK
jgi:hypothetical protein